ncbi:MAG: hypothetical protein GXP62_12960, partial [Oligoflexia bacterium]|nr:hypothetical protein [Oligoflexia bacterium]
MSPQPPTVRPTVQHASLALAAVVAHARAILLTGPVGPDGDSIGACLALAAGLRRLGHARVDVAGTASYRYSWMPGAQDMVADDQIRPDYDVVIVLDGDRRRLTPQVSAAFDRATATGIIDHHRSTGADGYDLPLLDPQAASTCDLVYELLLAWGHPIDRDIAGLIYAGLVFDTSGFRHSNTTPETHFLAASLMARGIDHVAITTRILMERSKAGLRLLGAVLSDARFYAADRVVVGIASHDLGRSLGAGPGDIDGIVDHLISTAGAELACLFIEQTPGQVKLSLRSRCCVDVAALARTLSPDGGGHCRAAGALLCDDLERV